jgi:hypothetical protein
MLSVLKASLSFMKCLLVSCKLLNFFAETHDIEKITKAIKPRM